MCKQSFPPVLLTRPAAQSARFAQVLERQFPGIAVHHAPLIAPEFLQATFPHREFAAVIFTSETGVEGVRRLMRGDRPHLPRTAFCVGGRTAEAARRAGFEAISAEGDVHALEALIRASAPKGPLLHVRGEDAAGDLVGSLKKAGLETDSLVVYAQRPQPLASTARALLAAPGKVIVPLFSPRTARIFVEACRELPLSAALLVAVISQNAADALADLPVAALQIAATPDAAGMQDAIARIVEVEAGRRNH